MLKINTYFIQLAITILVVFGGAFIIRYFRTGELLLDQMIGASVGILLLIVTMVYRKTFIKKPVA